MQIFFCVAAVPLPTLLNSGVQARHFFMLSHSVQSTAKPAAAWQLRYCFYFFWLMNVEQTL
jgi:hypothetical protein